MKKIIILSDIWGKEKSCWMAYYTTILGQCFDLQYYDCQQLGGVSVGKDNQEDIHLEFINNGIDKAVKNLLELEKEAFAIIGFSIGGYIAWKACLSGLKVNYLFAISSTRLRYETQKPKGEIQVFFGQEDKFRPSDAWFKQMSIIYKLYVNQGHELYQKREVAKSICQQMFDVIS
ncbi:alpha/beta hydrolase [Myroides sp. LJL116]